MSRRDAVHLAEMLELRESTVACADCANGGNLAACFGSYEDSPIKPSCNECCGHSNENGWCKPLDEEFWSGWQKALDRDAAQDAEVERLRALIPKAQRPTHYAATRDEVERLKLLIPKAQRP